MTRAVVFAYHDIGVRCLSVLLARHIDVPLVVTHRDDPNENIWFESVERLAGLHGIPVIAPENPNVPAIISIIKELRPDFVFSFYYRSMLKVELLQAATTGAFNMHGSLLPKYRGRAPVNWAIIRGESETGATLHEMVEKPDAGRIVDRQAVPILPNDVAVQVFRKVTLAAEMVLHRCLPALVAGTAHLMPQDLSQGSYFGGRRPEDGRIDWGSDAWTIHNLVRAVAPPYPGAFSDVRGRRLRLLRTLYTGRRAATIAPAVLRSEGDKLVVNCVDGGVLGILDAELDGEKLSPGGLAKAVGGECLALEN